MPEIIFQNSLASFCLMMLDGVLLLIAQRFHCIDHLLTGANATENNKKN